MSEKTLTIIDAVAPDTTTMYLDGEKWRHGPSIDKDGWLIDLMRRPESFEVETLYCEVSIENPPESLADVRAEYDAHLY